MHTQVNRIFAIREKIFLVHVDMFAKRIYNIRMMFAKREYRKGGIKIEVSEHRGRKGAVWV